MTNPLIPILNTAIEREAMTEERIDRLEGYCDGVSNHPPQAGRSQEYAEAWLDARDGERKLEGNA